MTGSIDRAAGLTAGLTIATSQFAVTGCPEGNARTVRDHIQRAAARGADVVLFPEAALTGYPGVDFSSFRDFRWDLLRAEFERVRESAVTHDCWVIVGSAHPLDREHAPTNCVYVIAPTGAIETRYDKRRLYGQEVDHYSVGEGATTFTIGGIRAGVLICYDSCFPELYAELESARVEVLFHAFYNARSRSRGAMDQLMPAQLRTRAHDHSFLIVGSNSSASHSAMPSCIAAPDGRFST